MLPDLSNENVVVGLKQLRKALIKGHAGHVYLAQDADPQLTGSIAELCMEQKVSACWCTSMAELGKACGIDVGASAAAVLRK